MLRRSKHRIGNARPLSFIHLFRERSLSVCCRAVSARVLELFERVLLKKYIVLEGGELGRKLEAITEVIHTIKDICE